MAKTGDNLLRLASPYEVFGFPPPGHTFYPVRTSIGANTALRPAGWVEPSINSSKQRTSP